jgi:hypothetical protein
LILPRFKIEGVNNFLSDEYIGGDMPSSNKSGLRIANKVSEMVLDSIGYKFRNNFVD